MRGEQLWVCDAHTQDPFLIAFIQEAIDADDGVDQPCSYCDTVGACDISEIADLVAGAIHRFYLTAQDSGVPWDSEDGCWAYATMDTAEVLDDLEVDLEGDAREDVVGLLDVDDWVGSYEPWYSPAARMRQAWTEFKEHVQHVSRFQLAPDEPASDSATDPDRAFGRREVLRLIGDAIQEMGLVRDMSPTDPVYRARTFDGSYPFADPRELVAPPAAKASQGRMNAAGVPVLYAALDPETAAAEVYDGKAFAAVAALRPRRPLRVVDLTSIPSLSPLDPEVEPDRFETTGFLQGFVRDVCKPIARDDRVHHEYAPTQFLTEYLRWSLETAPLDGIIFPSARTDGTNIVVFVTARECLSAQDLPDGEVSKQWSQLLELDDKVEIRTYGPPQSKASGRRPVRHDSRTPL